MSEQCSTVEAKFWRNVEKSEGCWYWTAGKVSFGYGAFYSGSGKNKKQLAAHRFSYELHYGPIPPGAHVLHRCDNPPCVRPEHLFLGNQQSNMADKAEKGRSIPWNVNLTHCKYGHEFTPENTSIHFNATSGRTQRVCKACARNRTRKSRQRKATKQN